MKTPTPIKRDKNLILLSRDHHDGLMLIWKTRQGIRFSVDNARIGKYIVSVFDKELEPHFIEEETLLFNKLPATDGLRIRAEEEHAAIRKKIVALRSPGEPEVSELMKFVALLEEHIRFEERVLFPYIEKALSHDELDKIGGQLQKDHWTKKCLVWEDEFWIKK